MAVWGRGRVGEDPRSLARVAEEDGQTIGFLTVERDLPIYLMDEFALVREWWVEPAHQGRGVGEAMIRYAIKALVRQFRVRTAPAHTVERAVLERGGFRAGSAEMVTEL